MTDPGGPTPVGTVVSAGARSAIVAQVGVQFGSAAATIILADILTTTEFGIVALSQSMLGLGGLIGLRGIMAAIVTHRGDVDRKASTYFWIALVLGSTIALLISLVAGPLVARLGQPGIEWYVRALTLMLPLNLIALVPQALLQRRLQFVRLNAVMLSGAWIYFVAEVVLALLGHGAWAVIWGQVIGAVATLLLALVLARWLPRHLPRARHVRDDVSLISNMGASSFFTYVGKNVDYWMVSGVLGAAALGVYYIAYVLPSIIRLRLSGVFRQVMLPVIRRVDDASEQARIWATTMRGTLLVALPAMTLLACVTGPVVEIAFGERWADAALPMQLITFAGIADLVIHAVPTLAIARKHLVGRTTALIALRAALVLVGAYLAAARWHSIAAVAVAVVVTSVVVLVIQEFWISRPLGIGWGTLGSGMTRMTAVCASTFVAASLIEPAVAHQPAVVELLIITGTALLVFAAAGGLFARAEVRESVAGVRRLVRGR